MTFVLGLDLFISGVWTSIAQDLSEAGVTITRGRPAEGSHSDPAQMTASLRNSDGRYSPRNPRSPLSGMIGRQTPVRCWVEWGEPRLVQDAGTRWRCPDSAGLSITGDIDLRVDLAPRTWRPGSATWLGLVKGEAYGLQLCEDGTIRLAWHDGAETQSLTSTWPVPGGITGRKAIRATLDADTGEGVAAATFYTADTITGEWMQLGAVVEHDDTTQIHDSAESLSTYLTIPSEMYGLEVRDGIGGTVRASVDWTDATSGATTHTDGQGNVWTRYGHSDVTNRHYRLVGEVASWPQRWGATGASSASAQIECAGVLRRLGQGASPLWSALRRGCESLPAQVAYWSLEDGETSVSLHGGPGTAAAQFTGEVTPGGYSGFVGSDTVCTIGDGGRVVGVVRAYPGSGECSVRALLLVPSSGIPQDAVLLQVRTSSTLGRADLWLTAAGGLYVKIYDRLGVLRHTTSTVAFAMNGRRVRLSLELKQDGADVDVTMATLGPGDPAAGVYSDTASGLAVGAVTDIVVNPSQADLSGTAVGHLTVEKTVTTLFGLASQLAGYSGERADTRMLRLADETAISLAVVGAGAGCERMGPQGIGDLVSLLRDAAESDGGILYEPRTDNALRYRSLESLWSQDPGVSLTYTGGLLQLEPVDDDESTRNRVTITRRLGGSCTVEDATGPLGTQAPPDGVGVYDEAVTLSLATDAAAEQQAGWRVHLGTTDEARWPRIGLDLAHPTFVADQGLTRRILALDVGDRLDVGGLPAWLPPFPVRQIIQGYSETITPPEPHERGRSSADPDFHHRIVFHCAPARPYSVGTYVASGYEVTTEIVESEATQLLSDDFTGTDDAALSANWTTGYTGTGASTAIQSNRGRWKTGTAGGYAGAARISRRAVITSPDDVEVSGTYLMQGESYPEIYVRSSDTAFDTQSGYAMRLPTPGGNGNLRLIRYVSYTGTTLDTSDAFSASNGTAYRWRFRVRGTSLKGRIWAASGAEPSDWNCEATDSTIAAAGYVGVSVGAGNTASTYIDVDDVVITDASDGDPISESTATPIDAGPSGTRYGSGGSVLDTALSIAGTSADVLVTAGPAWTTEAAEAPLDLLIGGEHVTCTAIGAASSGVQALTLTRAVNGISKAHPSGTPVALLDPVFWGARPLGGTLYTGGDTGGGGGDPADTDTPNVVRIGTATYPLAGVDPGTEDGWGGDPAYPGDRGADHLLVYTEAYGDATDTNQWGCECVVGSADDVVDSVHDREASQSLTGTTISAGTYVLSGHSVARQWLMAHAVVGALVELGYVAPSGGGTGGGIGGGGTAGGEIGTYPDAVVAVYKKVWASNTAVTAAPNAVTELRPSFAQGAPPTLTGYTSAGQAAMVASLAARRTAGTRIVVSVGGANGAVVTANRAQFLAGIASIKTILEGSAGGGLDGMDWDIETGGTFPTSDAVYISTQLKSTYGQSFAITMAPNGTNVGAYLPAAVQLHQAGALDNYGQQFYDYSNPKLADINSRVNEAINAGIPASKISIGFALTSPNPTGFWSQAAALAAMQSVRATYGIRKCYLWAEDATFTNGGVQTWTTNMLSAVS